MLDIYKVGPDKLKTFQVEHMHNSMRSFLATPSSDSAERPDTLHITLPPEEALVVTQYAAARMQQRGDTHVRCDCNSATWALTVAVYLFNERIMHYSLPA